MKMGNKPLDWSTFMSVEMRTATIIKAEPFPEARNPSYIIHADFGELGIKKTSAQITDLYNLEELVGKQIVGVVNFPKKQIATIQSEFLILGAIGDEKEVTLLGLDKSVKNGLRVG